MKYLQYQSKAGSPNEDVTKRLLTQCAAEYIIEVGIHRSLTLQRYLRHSDLITTIAYIADQPDEQVRETLNAVFTTS